MKVKIEFNIDNAAYREDEGSPSWPAVALAIKKVAGCFELGVTEGNIIDANGNKVGSYRVTR